jgi:hypothetical protein
MCNNSPVVPLAFLALSVIPEAFVQANYPSRLIQLSQPVVLTQRLQALDFPPGAEPA